MFLDKELSVSLSLCLQERDQCWHTGPVGALYLVRSSPTFHPLLHDLEEVERPAVRGKNRQESDNSLTENEEEEEKVIYGFATMAGKGSSSGDSDFHNRKAFQGLKRPTYFPFQGKRQLMFYTSFGNEQIALKPQ